MASPAVQAGAAPAIFSGDNVLTRILNRGADFGERFLDSRLQIDLLKEEFELELLKRRQSAAIDNFDARPIAAANTGSGQAQGFNANTLIGVAALGIGAVVLLKLVK